MEPSIQKKFLSFFSLNENPFDELRNTGFFYTSREHGEALERLRYGIADNGLNFMLLTGEIGSGKTLTRMVFQESLDEKKTAFIVLENPIYPFDDILYEFLGRLRTNEGESYYSHPSQLPRRGDRYALISQVETSIRSIFSREGRRVILLLDECQYLDKAELEGLKSLTNFTQKGGNGLSIILVGQPEFREKLKGVPSLEQRIGLKFHLNNLDLEGTSAYVSHRLRLAGHPEGNIVTLKAIDVLFRYTQGVPRKINRACKLSLEFAFARERREVDESLMSAVLEDLDGHSP